MHDVGAKQLQGASENHGGRHAINVVVAVDHDRLAPLRGQQQTLDGDIKIEQAAVLDMLETRAEIALGHLS
ncbi:MAG: hypothetical protein QOG20_5868, partial [Pseudonocardiales bacterium]|nr:hypothetical protein [Pseudonocardiales bacterium]